MFERRVQRSGARAALTSRVGGARRATSWSAWWQRSERVAAALIAHGVGPGDRVAIVSRTRIEWAIADMAILMCGAVTVPIFVATTPARALELLEDAQVHVAFVEGPIEVADLPRDGLEHLVCFDGVGVDRSGAQPRRVTLEQIEPRARTFDAFEDAGRAALSSDSELVSRRRAAITPEQLATIVYTSGATGAPRGVELTHANVCAELDAIARLELFGAEDVQLLALPLAHIFARVACYASVPTGMTIAFGDGMESLLGDLVEVRPTVFCGVPYIFERLLDGIDARTAAAAPGMRGAIERLASWADEEAASRREGRRSLRHRVFSRVVDPALRAPVRQLVGGRLRYFISGGAPLGEATARRLHALGLLTLEGWGLTETCAAASFNTPDAYRFGSVGRPLPGVDVTIAEDGEIYVQGGMVTAGYRGEDDDGLFDGPWLRTGDLGRFDTDGYLYITGRKKDLIVTSGGKNIAPSPIERALERSPLIEHAVVVGDRRGYLVALLTSSPGAGDPDAPETREAVQAHLDAVNEGLASFERVRRVALLPERLSVEAGWLTPTLKVRRDAVVASHASLVDALYAPNAPSVST
jgi:long-chain acyl-CoA synthetase